MNDAAATSATPPTTPTSPGSGATPSSPTPSAPATATTAPTPSGAQDTGFRYTPGPGIPDWAIGKTALEVAQIGGQLHAAMLTGAPAPSVQRQPVTGVPQGGYTGQGGYGNYPGNQGQPSAPPSADDFTTDPYTATQRLMEHVRTTQFEPVLNQTAHTLASQSRMLAEMRYGDEFRRWGPEIDLLAQQVPLTNRTADAYQMLVEVVKSRHLDEIANERAEQRLKQLVETQQLRPQAGGAGAGATSATLTNQVDFEKLPPNYAATLRRLGVTSDTIDEMLKSTYPDMPLHSAREKWFTLASKGDVITDAAGEKFRHDGVYNNG